uniref:hypothetical protein n=1 Tax=Methylobacterium sp. B34 TaxID=95563 RepID=UPI0011AEA966
MGSSTQTTNSQTNTNMGPWADQVNYLKDGFTDASNILSNRLRDGPTYNSGFVAHDADGTMRGAFNDASQWSTSTGRNISNNLMDYGRGQLNSGTGAQNGALSGLSNFAGQDMTAQNLKTAQAYMNPDVIRGQVNAAMYDARQNAAENVIPGIDRQASAGGNLNSDRTTLAKAVVDRGLNEQASNIAANLTANAYNQGLNMAQNQNAQQLQALGALGSLGSTAASQGYTGTQAGFTDAGNTYAMQQAAAAGRNSVDQLGMDDAQKNYLYQYSYPQQALNDYWGIVGSGNWGQQGQTNTQSTTTSSPSIMSQIGSGIGIFGSLFGCDVRLKHVL